MWRSAALGLLVGIALTGCGAATVAVARPAPAADAAHRIAAHPPASPTDPAPAAAALLAAQAAHPVPASADANLPSLGDLEESWARVLLRANPGPCQYVAYELTVRGPAGVASHVRAFMGRRDAVTRTELLPREALRKVFGSLRDLGALDLPHPPVPVPPAPAAPRRAKSKSAAPLVQAADDALPCPPRSAVPIYEFSFRLGGRENTFLVADPERLSDRRYAAFLELVRRVATQTAGEIGYHGPVGESGAEGYLFVDSVPGARVTIDGVLLGDETPILAYTLSPGSHTVVLENAALGLQRDYKVRIQPGLTTSLEVDLR